MSTASPPNEVATYLIGEMVTAGLEIAGRLDRVVINPLTGTLTHLVVAPLTGDDTSRLVPVSMVDLDQDPAGIALRCGPAEFAALPAAQESHFLPSVEGQHGYRSDQLSAWPYFGLGVSGMGLEATGYGLGPPSPIVTDRVPLDDVEVRRGDRVRATDGDIGKVQGLVINRADGQVTHVLLDEGHLWKHKRVAIPISALTTSTNGLSLRLSKDEVGNLPGVDIDMPPGQ